MTHQLVLRAYGLKLEEIDEIEARCRRLIKYNSQTDQLVGPRAVMVINEWDGITFFYREVPSDKWSVVLVTPVGKRLPSRSEAGLAPKALTWLRSYMALEDLARI